MSIPFQPKTIGKLEIENRFVRSATAEKAADERGRPTKALADIHADLARGGVGLIIAGHAYVRADGKAHRGMMGIYDDELIAGGLFTAAGGVSANKIARWNGTTWAPLGAGMNEFFLGNR